MGYHLEIETEICISIFSFPKSRAGLEEAFKRAECFLLLNPKGKASIVESSMQELVWSSSSANLPQRT